MPTLVGGAGADLFRFAPAQDRGGADVVVGFSAAQGDAFEIEAAPGATLAWAVGDFGGGAAADTRLTVTAPQGWGFTLVFQDVVLA